MTPEHVCELVVLPAGEAVCLGCAAYYIYQSTLTPQEMDEIRAEIEEGAA